MKFTDEDLATLDIDWFSIGVITKMYLIDAINEGNILKVKELISEKSNLNDVTNDELQIPAVQFALWKNRPDIAQLLLDNGADYNSVDNYGRNLLGLAAFFGYYDIVKYLIEEKNFNINKMSDKMTPLMNAVQKCEFEIAKYLINKGSDINAINDDGNSALFYAIESGSIEIVIFLIENGADLSHLNNNNESIIRFAHIECRNEILQLLILLKIFDISEIDNKDDFGLEDQIIINNYNIGLKIIYPILKNNRELSNKLGIRDLVNNVEAFIKKSHTMHINENSNIDELLNNELLEFRKIAVKIIKKILLKKKILPVDIQRILS